ncbi:actin-like ATPase domain-containing protein [Aspergillus granulosus]|uniref:Actin-like ATPase domain-containing protein n=1 Tax=Aspergillus granulosus TaxID=176169 RepID=A0ABR4HI83_9EURO
MAVREPARSKPHYLVIGVDFGTTYTGVSYTWSAAYRDDHDIITVTDWPAHTSFTENAAKAPTQIAYERDDTGRATNCWGYLIKPSTRRCVWMKLLLDRKARETEFDDPNLRSDLDKKAAFLPDGKTVEDVTTDFFRELHEFTMQTLSREYPDILLDMTPIRYWFTMPAIWSDQAQMKTLLAAREGGFGARRVDEVSVISEPEAAALATLTNSWPHYGEAIDPDEECILICDCGGGTVDLTTYKVVQDDPWELEECYVGNGGKCGAINLDRNLHELLSDRFKEHFIDLSDCLTGPGSPMMNDFERNKKTFGIPGERLIQLRLFMDVEESEYYDRFDGGIILSEKDMLRIFNPVVEKILKLIRAQVEMAHKAAETGAGPRISYLLPIGGLSDSPYLRHRLGKWCSERGIRMGGPLHSWGAVVKGAVVRGVEQATVVRKRCRRHYGQIADDVHNLQRHGRNPPGGTYKHPFTGETMVRKCMFWSIERGMTIKPGAFETRCFASWRRDQDRRLEVDLQSCSLHEAPIFFTKKEVEEVGTIVADISGVDFDRFQSKMTRSGRYYEVIYELRVILGHKQGTVSFEVVINGKIMAQTNVVFDGGRKMA